MLPGESSRDRAEPHSPGASVGGAGALQGLSALQRARLRARAAISVGVLVLPGKGLRGAGGGLRRRSLSHRPRSDEQDRRARDPGLSRAGAPSPAAPARRHLLSDHAEHLRGRHPPHGLDPASGLGLHSPQFLSPSSDAERPRDKEAVMTTRSPFLITRFGAYYHREVPAEDAELTHIGPGTPCGEYFRRFWQPICFSDDLRDVPRRATILGEELVVFRDLGGRVGLLELHCPHRGTSLEFGLLSERGIRCCYHGWLFDVDGTILDTPGEPTDSTLKNQLF